MIARRTDHARAAVEQLQGSDRPEALEPLGAAAALVTMTAALASPSLCGSAWRLIAVSQLGRIAPLAGRIKGSTPAEVWDGRAVAAPLMRCQNSGQDRLVEPCLGLLGAFRLGEGSAP
jgi:hypothetical protein